jgi:hypothetical protein
MNEHGLLVRSLAPRAALAALCLWAVLARDVGAQEFQYPLAAASSQDGRLYVVDVDLPGIWLYDCGAWVLYHQASKQFRTPLNRPRCAVVDAEGRLLVGDTPTREIYRFTAENKPEPFMQTPPGIGMPMGVAVNAAGDLLVADAETQWIWKVPAAGGAPEKFAEVPAPRGVCIDSDDRLWVVTGRGDALQRVKPDGSVETVVAGRPFQFPLQVVVNDDGTAFVSDNYAKTIWKVETDGTTSAWFEGDPLVSPVGIARYGDALVVADPHAKAVFQIDENRQITRIGGADAAP